jgi:hypothetical protein
MTNSLSRRVFFTRLVGGAVSLALASTRLLAQTKTQPKTPMVVFKDPECGCCEKWVAHMAASGFAVTVTNSSNLPAVKKRYHVPKAMESCHTGSVANYVIEGHVPAEDVKRLLAEKPAGIIGLAIPGMPASAPGMDLTPFQPYAVLTFDAKGTTAVFARHTKA